MYRCMYTHDLDVTMATVLVHVVQWILSNQDTIGSDYTVSV